MKGQGNMINTVSPEHFREIAEQGNIHTVTKLQQHISDKILKCISVLALISANVNSFVVFPTFKISINTIYDIYTI